MSNEFNYDVFLSHSSKDKEVVRAVAERLRQDGLKVWFDEWVLKPGDSIPAKIEDGLEHSRVLVLCMSAQAFGSDWASLEAGTFRFRDTLNKDRRFIPLRLDDAPIEGSLAQFLYINWRANEREEEYRKLLETCRPTGKDGLMTESAETRTSNAEDNDTLQAIRQSLQRIESARSSQEDRITRRKQLSEMLATKFSQLISFVGGMLASEQEPRSDSFFEELARSLLAFNATLIDADEEYPRYRIRERLRLASQTGIPALDTAASLLLTVPSYDVATLAGDLERIQASHPHDVWSLWLTYILDQLMNSHRPPARDNVPPDTTREEWRTAELAFGCILFSDESFRVIQESLDQAASQIDDAMKSGGYHVLSRPPARVRDMIVRFDPRALHWFGAEFPELQLLQPPPSIEAIIEPKAQRRQLDESWTAASCLQIAIDKWHEWFCGLSTTGDAHPAIALNCAEMGNRAINVLCVYRPNVAPFACGSERNIRAMLPPLPAWWIPGTKGAEVTEDTDVIERCRVRWQDDREFLDRYYYQPELRLQKSTELRGATAKLIEMLKSFPLSVVSESQEIDSRDMLVELNGVLWADAATEADTRGFQNMRQLPSSPECGSIISSIRKTARGLLISNPATSAPAWSERAV